MKTLRDALTDYLNMRRALGYELYRSGKALENFVHFAEKEGVTVITTDLALRWAKAPAHSKPTTWASRLALVRRFARYCTAIDPRTEIPPDGLLPHRYRRRRPYVYKDEEIRRLLLAARRVPSKQGLRSLTYETLFGLLASTGLRIGEALGLDDSDIDLDSGVLTIRNTKFGKTRYVPVHRSTGRALSHYARQRDCRAPKRESPAYFVTESGTRLSANAVRRMFLRLLRKAGIHTSQGCPRPRIHDLRHRFAVYTLLRWYRTREDVEAKLPHLATYLGHVHVADTYWYLSAVPELLQLVIRRVEEAGRKKRT